MPRGKTMKPKGTIVVFSCGHETKWPRPTTASGHAICQECGVVRKIESVKP